MAGVRRALAPALVALLVASAGCGFLGGGNGTPAGDTPAAATTAGGPATTTSGGPAGNATTDPPADGPSPTPTATPEPTPTLTPVVTHESGIVVTEINADPPGSDAENLNGEYIVIENTGDLPVDLEGWRVTDADGNVHTFKDVTLDNGESLTLHSGSGFQNDTDRYWIADGPVWDNNGDRVYIYDDGGQKIYERPYR